jgi:hypothetical protein
MVTSSVGPLCHPWDGCASPDRRENIPSARPLAYHLLILALFIGCSPTVEAPEEPCVVDPSLSREVREEVYQQTGRRFERAEFFSPDPDSVPGELRWMSPLIVEEQDPLQAEDPPLGRFGRLDTDVSGQVVVHSDQPTVYHQAQRVDVGDSSLEQSTFLWFYPCSQSGSEPSWRGFRMVLDQRGFAIVWELLSSEAPLRILYVSKPIENAARRQYGNALPERRYVVEPSVETHPDLVVARIVGDGPQPMGPFLYLDFPARRVSTLICRCEPSQVASFPASHLYQMVEIQQADPSIRLLIDRAVNHDAGGSIAALRLPSEMLDFSIHRDPGRAQAHWHDES